MTAREHELLPRVFAGLRRIPGLEILAGNEERRIGVISFFVEGVHYNLVVQLLNDRFGIQVRGGCSCAGTYGHYLLHVDWQQSHRITDKIDHGDLSEKPGWVRLSIHPTMTDAEVDFIIDAIDQVARNAGEWGRDYTYNSHTNEFNHRRDGQEAAHAIIGDGFRLPEIRSEEVA